jgi:AICAR transformylase/IMP cyclohydrolase PurH
VFKAKANVRLLKIALPQSAHAGPASDWDHGRNAVDVKRIGSGLLLQTADNHELQRADLKVVTKQAAHDPAMHDLLFAWKVAKYVKSNAIVFCKDGMTMGVGAGQMSRLDSARIASIKAEHAKPEPAGHGGGQRRLLPLPRRPGRGGGRGRDLRHPAGGLDARPGSDRRRQRARRGHGVHRGAALPPLSVMPA